MITFVLYSLKTPGSELTRIWVPGGQTRNPCQCDPESESKLPLLTKFLVTLTRTPGQSDPKMGLFHWDPNWVNSDPEV